MFKLLWEEYLFRDSDVSIQETVENEQDFFVVNVKLFISQEEICGWSEFHTGGETRHNWFSWGDFTIDKFLSDACKLFDESPRLVKLSRDRHKEAIRER
ncbi:hypothetical protein A9K97_gp458 [Tokyovirus A1]|uniref:hypothetical protein n=1 Tax=Tokyovirus A1 TaxID=1826170 RepID=UPI0007A9808C|nr:hypothetical protein A9K97_gp458 [Tokyovirus A1]BAU79893.1 hypothetical protein [Tokyovirus A1]